MTKDTTYIHPNFPRCPDTGKPILEISHSGLNSFNSCPRRWAFRKAIVSSDSFNDSSDASEVGSAFHDGLQRYLATRQLEDAIEALALSHPIELRNPEKASQYSLEASVITLEHVIANSELANYELARFNRDGKEVPAIEVPALVIIETPHLIFHLRQFIDLVLYSVTSGKFLAVDIKTTTAQGARFFEAKYRWDWQVTSYGIPLAGLLGVEGDFDVGVLGVIQSDRDPGVIFPTYPRTRQDVDEYGVWLLEAIGRMQAMWVAGQFPRNPSACVSFNKVCHYHSLCGARDLQAMQMLVNPAGTLPSPEKQRPFDPIYVAKLEVN